LKTENLEILNREIAGPTLVSVILERSEGSKGKDGCAPTAWMLRTAQDDGEREAGGRAVALSPVALSRFAPAHSDENIFRSERDAFARPRLTGAARPRRRKISAGKISRHGEI
jgi:hypothetical protein